MAPGVEGARSLQPGQSARGGVPVPGRSRLPGYPSVWIDRAPERVVVDALVMVDAQGSASIGALRADAAGCGEDCAQAFIDVVRTVLPEWEFLPLEVMDWIDGPDEDADGEPDSVDRGVVASLPYSLRLRFAFERRDGVPSVGLTEGP